MISSQTYAGPEVVTATLEEAVTTAELKAHLRIEHSDEDTYIAALEKAARRTVEREQSRALVETELRVYFPCFYDELILPRAPVSEIVSIKYDDTNDDEQTLATSVYQYTLADEPVRICAASGQYWPSVQSNNDYPVRVVFKAGYGADASAVPETTKQAIMMLAAHWYESREPVIAGVSVAEIPRTVDALIDIERWTP